MQAPPLDSEPQPLAGHPGPSGIGVWRPSAQAQRRDVAVSVEGAALVLRDPRGGAVLAHWALAATERLNQARAPALFGPQRDDEGETLEIEDRVLALAIDRICARIRGRRPRPGRLRLGVLAVSALLIAGLAVFWFPEALVRHAAGLVPPAKRIAIGQAALADVIRLTGAPCANPAGMRALARLSERLFGPQGTIFGAEGARILVLREGLGGVGGAAHLPGRLILLDRSLVEDFNTPEVAAGHALAEALRAEAVDPLLWVLRSAGVVATARLLTTGGLPEAALQGTGRRLLTTPPATLPPDQLASRFDAAGLRLGPFATVQRDRSLHDALMERARTAEAEARLLLPDADWVGLQGICGS